jgi:hypothetical protein
MLVIFDSQAFQERYQIGSIFYTKKPQKIIQVVVEVTPKWLGGTDGVIQLFNLMRALVQSNCWTENLT